MTAGFNPMRWDCQRDGCFNQKRRPRIEVFADCFPGNINFGDVDGDVELNGFFGQYEHKGDGGSIKKGQRIKFEQYSRAVGNFVIVAEGCAETMRIDRWCLFWCGRQTAWRTTGLDGLKLWLSAWALWAQQAASLGGINRTYQKTCVGNGIIPEWVMA